VAADFGATDLPDSGSVSVTFALIVLGLLFMISGGSYLAYQLQPIKQNYE